ncbi:MAG: HAMP domain-containing sensor histidine kinase, partial [Planctomycetota bacterium]
MSGSRPRTLLWQLGLALMVMQAVVAVVFGAWGLSKLKRFHYEQTTRQLEQHAPLVAASFAPLLADARTDETQILARNLGQRSGVRITVTQPDGVVVGDSDEEPAAMDNHRSRPEIDGALQHGAGSAVRFSQTLGTNMMYVARAVGDDEQPIGVVRVAMPLTAIDAELSRLLRLLGLAGLISLGLTFAVIYLVSRRLSRAVSHLARGALRFASGDLDHRIIKPASSELEMVTEAFNRMAGQLETHIAELRSRQTELQAILQSMSNGVLAVDAEQRVLSVNRAAENLLGLEGRSARGRLLQEVVREPQLHRFVSDALSAPGRLAEELAVGHGSPRALQATGEPLEDAEGRRVGLLLVLNDVTQLRRLETIRSDFAANVSHELQTPITTIKGYVETLLEAESRDRDESRRFLEIVNRNADRLAAIIEDLLALARLEEPGADRDLERAGTPLAPLLESVAAQYRHAASEKDMTLRLEVPVELEVSVNARLLEQAVSNLVSNAVKFAPTGTAVTLSACRTDEGGLDVAVADEGPGIDAAHLPRLFERFYRVDRARSRELGGTGLGLAIVKHIALVHGGRAEAESAAGSGNVFRIVLPAGT